MVSSIKQKLRTHRSQWSALAASNSLQGPDRYILQRRERLAFVDSRLMGAHKQFLAKQRQRYVSLVAKLDAMSPLKVLSRGYATVQNDAGKLMRSVTQAQHGDHIRINLHDGALNAQITDVEEVQL